MMLVFSATTAFHGPSAIPLTELGTMLESERQLMELSNESAQRNSDVGTIHIGWESSSWRSGLYYFES